MEVNAARKVMRREHNDEEVTFDATQHIFERFTFPAIDSEDKFTIKKSFSRKGKGKGKEIAKDSQDPPAASLIEEVRDTPLDKDEEMLPVPDTLADACLLSPGSPLPDACLSSPVPTVSPLPDACLSSPESPLPGSSPVPSASSLSDEMPDCSSPEADLASRASSEFLEDTSAEDIELPGPITSIIPPSSPQRSPASPNIDFKFSTIGVDQEEDMDVEGSQTSGNELFGTIEQLNTAGKLILPSLILSHIRPVCSICHRR